MYKFLFATLICLVLSQAQDIKVYLDNVFVPNNTLETPFQATIPNAPLTPIQMNGHWLVPVRFIELILQKEIWWDEGWNLLTIDNSLRFRVGERVVHFPVAAIGGTATGQQELEVVPQIIENRLYVSLESTLKLLRYTYSWNNGNLYICTAE